jgi:hypothetical protein
MNHQCQFRLASFVRTTDPDDPVLRIVLAHMQALRTAATAVVLNTFGELEGEVVAAMSAVLPPIYTVGPLRLLTEEQCKAAAAGSPLETLSANLTKEDDGCLSWLGSKEPGSVVYVGMQAARAYLQTCSARPAKNACWTTANILFFYCGSKRVVLLM